MTDKVQKIREEVERRIDNLPKLNPKTTEGADATLLYGIYMSILNFIDSLQEEPASKDKFTFTSLPRLLDRIKPTDRVKWYSSRLADALEKEGYITDAKIVRESIKIMNGEKVPMATMDEEPASEDLEEAICQSFIYHENRGDDFRSDKQIETAYRYGFETGAKWQKENLWKPADGDDLPEYDKEVIAILDYDFGHYKVVYAHRPNPNGWNGTNIDTEEKEYFEPVIYDKGGWNQPHVLYWLDAKLPYEENKITK